MTEPSAQASKFRSTAASQSSRGREGQEKGWAARCFRTTFLSIPEKPLWRSVPGKPSLWKHLSPCRAPILIWKLFIANTCWATQVRQGGLNHERQCWSIRPQPRRERSHGTAGEAVWPEGKFMKKGSVDALSLENRPIRDDLITECDLLRLEEERY